MTETITTTALIKQLETDSMATWTDDRREKFVKLFNTRTCTSQWLLNETARCMIEIAQRRSFISTKHCNKLYGLQKCSTRQNLDRQESELRPIAQEKAKLILQGLPTLKKAISIIDPETSKMVGEKIKLEATGQKYLDQINELSQDIIMADLDQTMTIGIFRATVKKRDRRRKSYVNKLVDLGEELNTLTKDIDKRLHSGIPGLTEAVMKAVTSCFEKATAIGEVNRRVHEQVMFGDSEAAKEILQSFESNELEVSDTIKAEFKEALVKLKLTSGKAKPKAKRKVKQIAKK